MQSSVLWHYTVMKLSDGHCINRRIDNNLIIKNNNLEGKNEFFEIF